MIGPINGSALTNLTAAGVERLPRVVGARNGLPLVEGDRVLEVANVIWCTGFHPGFSWLDLPVFDTGGTAIAGIDVQVDNLERSALEEVLPALTTAARCLGREIAPPGGTSARPARLPTAR